jgi:hypothetical protein
VDEFIENHSHDISKGGIFIKTRAPFPAGTLLKFEVRIAEDQRLMQGVGARGLAPGARARGGGLSRRNGHQVHQDR